MIEILKIFAEKMNGNASVAATSMILIYLLGTAAVVNNIVLCVSLVTFLAVFFLTAQFIKKAATGKKNKKEKTEEK